MIDTPEDKLYYGLNTCFDLHNKLRYEGENLENNWTAYACFNFIVTAWHLHTDWIDADEENRPKLATTKKGSKKTPANMMLVVYALRDITNYSKHSFLKKDAVKKKVITKIYPPIIGDWRSYFLDGPMIYVEINNSIYSMWDIRHIVLLYFDWIFNDDIPANQFPVEIQDHLKRCIVRE